MILCMVKVTNLEVTQTEPEDIEDVFKDINDDQPPPLHLSFISSLIKLIKQSWSHSMSVSQVPRKTENHARVHGDSTDFLFKHPLPNSFIVDATQNRVRARSAVAPTNREGRKMDMMGRRHYSLAAFILRGANYIAAMGAYQKHLWDKVQPWLQLLPEKDHPIVLGYYKEAMLLARQEMIAARHVINTASRQAAALITLQHQAWLCSASIPEDAQAQIEDLPFDGFGLFDSKTDDILENLQKYRKMAKSYSSQNTYRSYRQL